MSWRAEYIVLIVVSTLIDYFAGIAIYNTNNRLHKRLYLLLSLIGNFGLLFSFKYFNFVNDSLRYLCSILHLSYQVPNLDILLPVGISFYTFQTLSYTFEIYLNNKKPERHLGIFALYVAFFPQLVAGPIERAHSLLPQFWEKHNFDYERTTRGLRQILWGLFKKAVIADRLALLVDTIYSNPKDFSGPTFVIATVFFAFQIYCDFSAYSDIAIGSANLMGFDLMKNFDRPYFARSIKEFWSRWHISLSTWFRDYVYIPLGGNRVNPMHQHFNILITFFLSGVWHGAGWTFVVWGTLHGLYYLVSTQTSHLTRSFAKKLHLDHLPHVIAGVQILTTFTLVCFAWIFFRANSIGDAFYIIRHLSSGWHMPLFLDTLHQGTLGLSYANFILSIGLIALLLTIEVITYSQKIKDVFFQTGPWVRWPVYLFLTLSIMNLGITKVVPFIYFQF